MSHNVQGVYKYVGRNVQVYTSKLSNGGRFRWITMIVAKCILPRNVVVLCSCTADMSPHHRNDDMFYFGKVHEIISESQYEAAMAESKLNNIQSHQHGDPDANEDVFLNKIISEVKTPTIHPHDSIRTSCHRITCSLL